LTGGKFWHFNHRFDSCTMCVLRMRLFAHPVTVFLTSFLSLASHECKKN
jgi:hypothetical protein